MIILSKGNQLDSFVQFITVLLIFLFVLVITYFVTRWVSKFQRTQFNGKNIEVIETSRISASKYIQIIRIADKYMAVAVCKDTVTTLCEIPKDSIDFQIESVGKTADFSEIFNQIKNAGAQKSKSTEKEKQAYEEDKSQT